VLAGPFFVFRELTYAFWQQVSTIFSEIIAAKIFLMTVLNLHHKAGASTLPDSGNCGVFAASSLRRRFADTGDMHRFCLLQWRSAHLNDTQM